MTRPPLEIAAELDMGVAGDPSMPRGTRSLIREAAAAIRQMQPAWDLLQWANRLHDPEIDRLINELRVAVARQSAVGNVT